MSSYELQTLLQYFLQAYVQLPQAFFFLVLYYGPVLLMCIFKNVKFPQGSAGNQIWQLWNWMKPKHKAAIDTLPFFLPYLKK